MFTAITRLTHSRRWKRGSTKARRENGVPVIGAATVECLESRTLLTVAYKVLDLGVLPGGTTSAAYGLNQAGAVVGNATAANGVTHGFKFINGKMTDLGNPLSSVVSHGYAINAKGDVTGEAVIGKYDHAVLFSNGVMHDLGTLGGNSSFAYAINDSQTVVGGSYIAGNTVVHAFIWTPARGMKDLGTLGGGFSLAYGITAAGKIVGYSTNPHGQNHAFVFDGAMHDLGVLAGATRSIAYAMNVFGQIAGSAKVAGNEHAVLYAAGKFSDLGTLGGISSSAYAINDSGTLVGESTLRNSTTTHAFEYHGGKMYDLNQEIDPATGWTLLDASGVNNAGQIVGLGMIHGKIHGFLLTKILA